VNAAAPYRHPASRLHLQTVARCCRATARLAAGSLPASDLAGEVHFRDPSTRSPDASTDAGGCSAHQAVLTARSLVRLPEGLSPTALSEPTTSCWPAGPSPGSPLPQWDPSFIADAAAEPRVLLDNRSCTHTAPITSTRPTDYYTTLLVSARWRVVAENGGLAADQPSSSSRAVDARPRPAGSPRWTDGARVGPPRRLPLGQPECAAGAGRGLRGTPVNEAAHWQVAAKPELSSADASASQGFSSEQAQVVGRPPPVVGRTHPADPATAAADDLAGRALKRTPC